MTTQREALLDKIRALLARTVENGCTESETLAALAKARAMMDAYAVGDDELNLTKEEKAILRHEPPGSKDPHRIKKLLAESVATFCDCTVWRDLSRGGILVFCGLRPDAQFATWLLDTLAAFVQNEIVNHLSKSRMAERWIRCAEVFKSQRAAANPAKRFDERASRQPLPVPPGAP